MIFPIIFTIIVLVLLIGVAVSLWTEYQVLLQNGRLLVRIEALEQVWSAPATALPAQPEPSLGLPVGTMGMDFELPNVWGGNAVRSRWRGQRLLLIFINPDCPFSRMLLSALAAAEAAGPAERPQVVLVSTGDAAENRRLLEEVGLHVPLLVQEHWEVASLYQVTGTPMGYVLDERGAIQTELTAGVQELMALLGTLPEATSGSEPASSEASVTPHIGDAGDTLGSGLMPLTERPAGSVAPSFSLPRLDMGEVSLAEYRGRRLLLVFSDPACGPCDLLAQQLEERYRSSSLAMLEISRREPEINRSRAARLGLSYPIVLQQHWEVSREYGVLATPCGVLIDEEGTIAAGVAVGVGPILALADQGTAGL